MKELTNLIHSLSKEDERNLKSRLLYNEEKRGGRRLELLELISSGKIKTNADARSLLYNKPSFAALSQLKSRLENDIIDVVSSSGSGVTSVKENQDIIPYCFKILSFSCKLIINGQDQLAHKYLLKIEQIAEHHELTGIHVVIIELLQNLRGSNHHQVEFEKYNKKIKPLVASLGNEFKAAEKYYKLTLPLVYKKNQEYKYEKLASITLKELYQLAKNTNSSKIWFYYFKTAINGYSIKQNFIKAYKIAQDFNEFIDKNKQWAGNKRKAHAYLQLAVIALELKKYNEAFEYAEKAKMLCNPARINYLGVLLIQFTILLKENKLTKATKIYQLALKNPFTKIGNIDFYHWHYLKAVLAFSKKDYSTAASILNTHTVLLKDSSGWAIGYHLLSLMCCIERDDSEMALIRLRAFKQHLNRHKAENITRYVAICQLLQHLIKNELNFSNLIQPNKDLLKKLSTERGLYYRDPLAFEVIPFQVWFFDIASRKSEG